jgi:hypothetical protein
MKRAIPLLLVFGMYLFKAWADDPAGALPDAQTLVGDFQKEIATQTGPGESAAAICRRAFASQRVELVACCFTRWPGVGYFPRAMREVPESGFKDEVVLMMLRSAPVWLDEGLDIDTGGVSVHHETLGNLMEGTLERYLKKGSDWTYEDFMSDKARRALADKLEKQMGAGANFRKEIAAAKDNAAERDSLCRRAFAEKSLDLVEACFDANLIVPFLDRLAREPDSRFKDSVVLVMLRGAGTTWHDRLPGAAVEMNAAAYFPLAEMAIPVLKKYLPETPLPYESFRDRAQRLEYAEELEKAMAGRDQKG